MAYADVKEGWTAGGGGTVYGSARSACEGFLRETRGSDGVKFVVERMEKTEAGDEMCWYENAADTEGPAVTQVLAYRVRRQTYEGVPIYRGAMAAQRIQVTTLEHDLGPGVYYAKEQWVARAYAQAAFLEAYTAATPAQKVPDAIVYEYDFKAPDGVLDFSSGALLAEFERVACTTLTAAVAERMFDGEVNPVHYYKAFAAFVATKKKKPADYKVVIGPDYRHSIAGNGQQDPELNCNTPQKDRMTRRQQQIRITDTKFVKSLDGKAMTSLETRGPSRDDVAAALVGHRTHALFASCTPTAKSGSCRAWTFPAGRLIYLRRKWQSSVHHQKAKPGSNVNHYHLRVGDIFVDGTFMQFDGAAADDEAKAELFVGTRAQLIARLDNFVQPEIKGASGAQMFEAFWNSPLFTVNGVVPRLGYRASGEAEWNPTPP